MIPGTTLKDLMKLAGKVVNPCAVKIGRWAGGVR